MSSPTTRRLATRPLALGITAALLAAAACPGESYDVRVILDDDWLGDRARNVDVYLVDDCDRVGHDGAAPAAWAAAVHFAPDEAADRLGEVEPGDYGLYAVLRDEDCEAIAAGCAPVSLEAGAGGVLSVEVNHVDGRGCDADERCDAGQCVSEGPDADADADGDCGETLCRAETRDGCCPEGCTAVNDQDCCDAAECRDVADICCPSSCRVWEDSDCCEAAACDFFDDDGCCPAHCHEFDDVDC